MFKKQPFSRFIRHHEFIFFPLNHILFVAKHSGITVFLKNTFDAALEDIFGGCIMKLIYDALKCSLHGQLTRIWKRAYIFPFLRLHLFFFSLPYPFFTLYISYWHSLFIIWFCFCLILHFSFLQRHTCSFFFSLSRSPRVSRE